MLGIRTLRIIYQGMYLLYLVICNIVEYPQNLMLKIIWTIFLGDGPIPGIPGIFLFCICIITKEISTCLPFFLKPHISHQHLFQKIGFPVLTRDGLSGSSGSNLQPLASGRNGWLGRTFRSGNAGMGIERCWSKRVYGGREDERMGFVVLIFGDDM